MAKPRIGVLALQGAFKLHRPHLEAAGAEYVEISSCADLEGTDGLILPGGESGTVLKLIDNFGLWNELRGYLESKPSWGICAGAILIARRVLNPSQKSFGALDITVQRNAYGRQLESLESVIDGYGVSYIRAPKIVDVGPGVEVLATRDGSPVWIEQDRFIATTFHPEINFNFASPWHRRFVEKCLRDKVRRGTGSSI